MPRTPSHRQAFLAYTMASTICLIGCFASEITPTPGSGPAPGTGSVGNTDSGGAAGSGGTTGSGGMMGSGGMGGMMRPDAMMAASGGTMGTDAADAAPAVKPETTPDAGADLAAAGPPTFTELFDTLFGTPAATTSSCAGANCHNPGVRDAVNLATKMQAYTTLRAKVTPGNPGNSTLIRRLESTNLGQRMPLGKPPLTMAQIARVRSWIMAGALNN